MLTSLSLLLLTPACLILVFLLRSLLPSSHLLRVTAFALFPCFLSFLDYISASVLPSFSFPLPLLLSVFPFSSLPPPCSVYWSFLNSSSLFFFSFLRLVLPQYSCLLVSHLFPFISSPCNSPIPLLFLAFLPPFFFQFSYSSFLPRFPISLLSSGFFFSSFLPCFPISLLLSPVFLFLSSSSLSYLPSLFRFLLLLSPSFLEILHLPVCAFEELNCPLFLYPSLSLSLPLYVNVNKTTVLPVVACFNYVF